MASPREAATNAPIVAPDRLWTAGVSGEGKPYADRQADGERAAKSTTNVYAAARIVAPINAILERINE